MHLPANTLLQGGKYRIVRFISSGGFGCTYEAEHVMLEERIAIKEFFVGDFCNRDEVSGHVTVATQKKQGLIAKLQRKFIEEARSLCRLHHPGIVSVSDVFEENGTAYFVMDYIEGRSLGEIVNKEGPLSEERALRYIRQVSAALQYVHENNRLHLDIKPGNIMIDGNDDAILIDFGASKQYDEESGENTSTLLGKTPGYAPPEQMSNSVVKFLPATDIYALGATLYKVLTGVTPPDAFMRISGQADLVPLPSTISAPVREAVESAMSIKLSDRPQTVSAFLQLLDACGTDGEEGDETTLDPEPSVQPKVSVPPVNPSQPKTSVSPEKPAQQKPVQPEKPKETSSSEENVQENKKPFPWWILWWILALVAGVISVVVLLSVIRPKPVVVESISMDMESLSMQEGESAILSVQYTPSNADDTRTKWTSMDEDVAQVDKSGKVKAISVGTAKIIASCNKKEAFCNLTVIPEIEMVYVAGGTFKMGATPEQGSDARDNEFPVHEAKLSDYYIGKYEVTQSLWESVMGTNPSEIKGSNLPVENVSWNDVQEFIRRLNAMTGKKYRLPTEAEWEYAARGGNKSRGYKYSGSDDIGTVAWYYGNSGNKTHPVGTKAANELGIHDMSGNVSEWCSDWYGAYSDGSQTNPRGPSSGSNRVHRGGSFHYNARFCRVSYRNNYSSPDIRFNIFGFRLAASSL